MQKEMIEASAPTRLSLLGGGTDLDSYARTYGGIVLSLAINIRQQLKFEPEGVGSFELEEGSHIDFFTKIAREAGVPHGFSLKQKFGGEITGGLGSSASAAVALIGAIDKYQETNMTKSEIAEKAWDIEVNKMGMFGGKQDQYAAAHGGVNVFQFGEKVEVTPLGSSFIEKLLPNLVLFYTGTNRKTSNIQKGLEILTTDQIHALSFIKRATTDGIELLVKGDVEGFGRLMDLVWEAKKKSNKVSNPEIDKIYDKGIKLGAWGGKLMGSGGGGYMFFIVPEDKKQNLISKIGVPQIDFSIDWNGLDVRKI
jgi:D-glycero-alpha-D-manno-heptose-7-phosphate kinase